VHRQSAHRLPEAFLFTRPVLGLTLPSALHEIVIDNVVCRSINGRISTGMSNQRLVPAFPQPTRVLVRFDLDQVNLPGFKVWHKLTKALPPQAVPAMFE
jgi:hypothetical protein